MIGEIAMAMKTRRTATVRTVTFTELLSLSRQVFQQAARAVPQTAEAMVGYAVKRMRVVGGSCDALGAGRRAQGAGRRARGSGLGARDSGLGARGSGLRVLGSGFRAQVLGLRAQGSRLGAQGSELRA